MGRQINYYMGYEDFLLVAQQAIASGCKILKTDNGKVLIGDTIDFISKDVNRYYFYVPEAGELGIQISNGRESIGGYSPSGNVTIEAGFSKVDPEHKRISRARLFSITGYYDPEGNWIERPSSVTKIYNKLVRTVKNVAPYTEIVDAITSISDDDYLQKREWRHKEYISEALLYLRNDAAYKLG